VARQVCCPLRQSLAKMLEQSEAKRVMIDVRRLMHWERMICNGAHEATVAPYLSMGPNKSYIW